MKHNRIVSLLSLIFSALLIQPVFSQQQQQQPVNENITITTYYPAPFGVYQQLVTTTLGVGDTNGDGIIDDRDAPDPTTNPGDVWIAGKVGIGTNNPIPGSTLHVNSNGQGAILITGASDNGLTYSALYLGSDDVSANGVSNNSWVLTHKKELGNSNQDAFQIGKWTNGAIITPLMITPNGNVGIGTSNPQAKLDVNGRLLRNGQPFSFAGNVNHNAIITVPWGTTADWNIFVSPRVMGLVEGQNEGDNALLMIECWADEISNTQWRIRARYRFKYWNDPAKPGWWHSGTANYILVPR
jgi:hypothetical protein